MCFVLSDRNEASEVRVRALDSLVISCKRILQTWIFPNVVNQSPIFLLIICLCRFKIKQRQKNNGNKRDAEKSDTLASLASPFSHACLSWMVNMSKMKSAIKEMAITRTLHQIWVFILIVA